ncbi:hypothetical protein TYRP_017229 [Tyrophagus putrescentiae]|nr:hypothetical protein TYRP_017229 [Tyrophagus putrescentiae]
MTPSDHSRKGVILISVEHLRWTVAQRADVPRHGHARVLVHAQAEAKVGQHQVTGAVEEQVRGREVAVNEAQSVKHIHGGGHLGGVEAGKALRKGSPVGEQQLRKVTAGVQVKDEEETSINSFQPRSIFLLNHSKAACATANYSEEDSLIFTRDVSPSQTWPQLTRSFVFGQLNFLLSYVSNEKPFQLATRQKAVAFSGKRPVISQVFGTSSRPSGSILGLNSSKAACPTADNSEEDALIFTGNVIVGHSSLGALSLGS